MYRSTAEGLLLTLYVGVPLDLWEAFWFGSYLTGEVRRRAFLTIFELEIVSIVLVEGELPVTVVRPVNLPLWVESSLYLLTPAAACLSGCQQSKPPHLT